MWVNAQNAFICAKSLHPLSNTNRKQVFHEHRLKTPITSPTHIMIRKYLHPGERETAHSDFRCSTPRPKFTFNRIAVAAFVVETMFNVSTRPYTIYTRIIRVDPLYTLCAKWYLDVDCSIANKTVIYLNELLLICDKFVCCILYIQYLLNNKNDKTCI